MKYILFIIFVFIAYLSCSNDADSNLLEIAKFQKINDTLKAKEVKTEGYLFRTPRIVLSTNKLVVYDDIEEKMFKIFSYPEVNYLFSWGNKGNGPNEINRVDPPSLNSTNNGFEFLDGNIFRKYEFDSINKVRLIERIEIKPPDPTPINGFCNLSDSRFIIANFLEENGNYEHILINSSGKMIKYFGSYPKDDIVFRDFYDKYRYYNKSLVANPSGPQVMAFYMKQNRIKLYNKNGKLLKEVILKNNNKGDKSKKINDGVITFANPIGTHDYVYVLYANSSKKEIIDNPDTYNPELQIWDWYGNFLNRFILNKPIIAFCISEKDKRIYGVDIDGGSRLFEFNLGIGKSQQQNDAEIETSNYRFDLVETKFYKVRIPSGWRVNPTYKNRMDDIRETKLGRKINANYFSDPNKSAEDKCGSTLKILIDFIDDSIHFDFEKFFTGQYENISINSDVNNFYSEIDTIAEDLLSRKLIYEKDVVDPKGENFHTKNTKWIFTSRNRIYEIHFTSCRNFDDHIHLIDQMVNSMEFLY